MKKFTIKYKLIISMVSIVLITIISNSIATIQVNNTQSFLGIHIPSIIIAFLFTFIITVILIKEIISPLSKFIKRIRQMNQDEKYETIKDIFSNGEIQELITVFNRMVNKVNSQQIELEDQNEELAAQKEELTAQNEEFIAQEQELQDILLKLTKHDERLNRLYEFSQLLNQTIVLEELIENALRALQDEVNAHVGAFILYDSDKDELITRNSSGVLHDQCLRPLKLGEGLAGRAAQQKKVLVVNYGQGELTSQGLHGKLSMTSEIYLPLVVSERLLGVIVLGRLDMTPFDDKEKKLLIALCDQISVALDNAITHLETQKALNKVQEVDQLKSEMINTVSHELRTPLASILGFSELLLVKQLNVDKSKKYLTTIHNEAERLKKLINDFLDLQKIENGSMEFVKEKIDLEELLKSSIDVYRDQGKHSLVLDIDKDLPLIFTDPNKIQQVIGNLLSNAIKYSIDGGEIKVKVSQNSPKQVTISVKDSGLGIPEEALKDLFQPFFRVDNSDRREIGGTGLGLAICRKIIKELGGEIWVNSIHGQGSTFIFTLPLVENMSNSVETRVIEEETIAKMNNSILVIEDDKSMSDLINESLDQAGYKSIVFDNGPSALDFINQEKPVAIILDLILYGPLDGWEVLRRLKKNATTKDIPVIISSCIDQKTMARVHDIADYLVKPFSQEKLLNSVRTIIQNSNGAIGVHQIKAEGDEEFNIRKALSDKGFLVTDIKKEEEVFVVNINTADFNEIEVANSEIS